MPEFKAFPKPDLSRYPEIPEGACLNFNNHYGYYQVYRSFQKEDPKTGKKRQSRITYGTIRSDGTFVPSPTWLLSKERDELKDRLAQKDARTEELFKGAAEAASKAAKESRADSRQQGKVTHRLEPLLLGALLRALSGRSDAASVSDALNGRLREELFSVYCPELLSDRPVSRDTVRKAMMLAEPAKFADLCSRLTAGLASRLEGRVVAADGQAVRASRSSGSEGAEGSAYMIMNFYDAAGRVCVGQKVTDKKTNEITAGPQILKALDVRGATVTADAMSCQAGFAGDVIGKGAHYLLALKGNQDRMADEAVSLFAMHDAKALSLDPVTELDHGRIETRQTSVLKASLFSPDILERWEGLKEGSIIRIIRDRTEKSTGKAGSEVAWYITSMAPVRENLEKIAQTVREHWSIENRLHWLLDMRFSQDRMQANDPAYIANRSALNKTALAMVEHWRFWLWETKKTPKVLSVKQAMERCEQPKEALECLCCALGML